MNLKAFSLFLILTTGSSNGIAGDKCDKTINDTIRYGEQYRFDYTFRTGSEPVKIDDFLPEFRERFDFDGKAGTIDYKWTDEILKTEGVIEPNQSIVIVRAAEPYRIKYHGPTREQNDLAFRYVIKFFKKTADGSWATEPETETVCINYAISWCGDGVKDTQYRETCDDGSLNGTFLSSCSKYCHK